MAQTDTNAVLRRLPIVVGILGSSLLILNRLLTPTLTDTQARSDVMGIILSAVLVLTGLLWQRVQPRSPDAVTLEGETGLELAENLPEAIQTELAWASYLILTNTVTGLPRSRLVTAGDLGAAIHRNPRGNFAAGFRPG